MAHLSGADGKFNPWARFLVQALVFIAGFDALTWLTTPESASAKSYNWAFEILSPGEWGLVALINSTVLFCALLIDGSKLSSILAKIGLVLEGGRTAVFGMSLLLAVINGSASGLTGVAKWWLVTGLAFMLLTQPSLLDDLDG